MYKLYYQNKSIKIPTEKQASQIITSSFLKSSQHDLVSTLNLAKAHYALAMYKKNSSKYETKRNFNNAISTIINSNHQNSILAIEDLILFLFNKVLWIDENIKPDLEKIIAIGIPVYDKMRPRYVKLLLKAILKLSDSLSSRDNLDSHKRVYYLAKIGVKIYKNNLPYRFRNKTLLSAFYALGSWSCLNKKHLSIKLLNKAIKYSSKQKISPWIINILNAIATKYARQNIIESRVCYILNSLIIGDLSALNALYGIANNPIIKSCSKELIYTVLNVTNFYQLSLKCSHKSDEKITYKVLESVIRLLNQIRFRLVISLMINDSYSFAEKYFQHEIKKCIISNNNSILKFPIFTKK